jgi:alpha-tubulin suppressor-like RCC1 family protein
MRVLHWVVPAAVMAGLVLAVPASASTPPIIILPPLPTVHRVLGEGRNDYGQLSANNTTTYTSPVTALGLPDSISRIASGQLFSVAVTSSGAAYD